MLCIGVPLACYYARIASQPNWTGADPSTLQKLVSQKFQLDADSESNQDCVICMVPFQDQDDVIVLPCATNHRFHQSCIEHWLKEKNTCPLCN